MSIITALADLNARFHYRRDKGESWKILKGKGQIYGDCEDYSLTLIWLAEGKSIIRFWLALMTFKYVLWNCLSPRGVGHGVLWVRGHGWVDNIQKEFVPSVRAKGYKLRFPYPFFWVAMFFLFRPLLRLRRVSGVAAGICRASQIIPLILKHEGGYVNHPSDPGGATNKGITLVTFRRYVKRNGTIADLKALTAAQATIVYKRQYWDKVLADMLPPGVDYAVADFAVNSGPYRAAMYLQRVVGARADGMIGPKTLAAVEAKDPREVIHELCDARLAFMRRIQRGKLWKTFGRGWSRRVADVRRKALADAA